MQARGMKTTHTDFSEIPHGMYLIEAFHESQGRVIYHLGLKLNDGEWYDQVRCPVYSESITPDKFTSFWKWAKENLPIYKQEHPIKAA